MKVAEQYSHLNGWEFLQVHKRKLWNEIIAVIKAVDADGLPKKISKEKGRAGREQYAPKELNKAFQTAFATRNWRESRTSYWVTREVGLIRKTMQLPAAEQKKEIEAAGAQAIYSYNQTDFVKERVAVEVQFGKYFAVAYDLFVKHLAFYIGDVIDVGVEIVPMKAFQDKFASGSAYYEGELYNVIREGRGVPAVPLVLIGVIP